MKTFGQFCPLAQATQLLCERWTLLVVRELVAGLGKSGNRDVPERARRRCRHCNQEPIGHDDSGLDLPDGVRRRRQTGKYRGLRRRKANDKLIGLVAGEWAVATWLARGCAPTGLGIDRG